MNSFDIYFLIIIVAALNRYFIVIHSLGKIFLEVGLGNPVNDRVAC